MRGLIVLLGLLGCLQGAAQSAPDSPAPAAPRNPFSPAAGPERQPVLRAIVRGERALAVIEFQGAVQVALAPGAVHAGWKLVRIRELSVLLRRAGVEVEVALPEASP
ncbi:MAG: hypothetical protein ISN29_06275 [Gammaproteobacteria bacterium AqS3]|nr:hypothetical protein [Gammaproteobacteria bacterium AqS3]